MSLGEYIVGKKLQKKDRCYMWLQENYGCCLVKVVLYKISFCGYHENNCITTTFLFELQLHVVGNILFYFCRNHENVIVGN